MAGGERQERQYEQRLQEAEQQLRVQAQVYINNIFYHDLRFYLIIMTLIRKIKMIKPPF